MSTPPRLGQVIAQLYGEDHLPIGPGEWLVATEGTAQTVSEKLGVNGTPPKVGASVLVVSVSGYFGRLNPNVWEWIKTKWGSA